MNYFNYFTEIEEHFQRARSSGTFMLSPLDWALIEVWKDSGVPIEAVHKGIDRAFEKWHNRKRRMRAVNSLAYCSQEVLSAAREIEDRTATVTRNTHIANFDSSELVEYFKTRSDLVRVAADSGNGEFRKTCQETADSLDQLASVVRGGSVADLSEMEQQLTVLEERLLASAVQRSTEKEMLQIRHELDSCLTPYRHKMTAGQLSLLEKQFLQRQVFEGAGLPRLSLFYLK